MYNTSPEILLRDIFDITARLRFAAKFSEARVVDFWLVLTLSLLSG